MLLVHDYCFVGACPALTGPLVNYIRDDRRSVDATYGTFHRWANLSDLKRLQFEMGYGRDTGLFMRNDWGTSYHRTTLPSGEPAWYFVWSAMEHVFVPCGMRFDLDEETRLAVEAGY